MIFTFTKPTPGEELAGFEDWSFSPPSVIPRVRGEGPGGDDLTGVLEGEGSDQLGSNLATDIAFFLKAKASLMNTDTAC